MLILYTIDATNPIDDQKPVDCWLFHFIKH